MTKSNETFSGQLAAVDKKVEKLDAKRPQEIEMSEGDVKDFEKLAYCSTIMALHAKLYEAVLDAEQRLKTVSHLGAQAKTDAEKLRFKLFPKYKLEFDTNITVNTKERKIFLQG